MSLISAASLSNTPSPTASLRRQQQQQRTRRSKSCEKRAFLSSDNAEMVLPKLPESLEYDIRCKFEASVLFWNEILIFGFSYFSIAS